MSETLLLSPPDGSAEAGIDVSGDKLRRDLVPGFGERSPAESVHIDVDLRESDTRSIHVNIGSVAVDTEDLRNRLVKTKRKAA